MTTLVSRHAITQQSPSRVDVAFHTHYPRRRGLRQKHAHCEQRIWRTVSQRLALSANLLPCPCSFLFLCLINDSLSNRECEVPGSSLTAAATTCSMEGDLKWWRVMTASDTLPTSVMLGVLHLHMKPRHCHLSCAPVIEEKANLKIGRLWPEMIHIVAARIGRKTASSDGDVKADICFLIRVDGHFDWVHTGAGREMNHSRHVVPDCGENVLGQGLVKSHRNVV